MFGFGKKKRVDPVQPELVLPPVGGKGKTGDPRASINNLLAEQQKERAEALEKERRAVNSVADRERQMLTQIAALRTQVQEQQDEISRANRTEEDLHKALRLAAEKLSSVQAGEMAMRAELDDTRQQLVDTQVEVQTLRARLFGEKGVRLTPVALGRSTTSAGKHEDDVIAAIVSGAAPAARDATAVAEGRAAAARSSRQQLKRLLHFVKTQLADDVSAFSGASDDAADELSDGIGRRRHLIAKLEAALYDLLGGAPVRRASGSSAALAGPDGGGSGWQPRVHGHSLPRTVAVNEGAVRPILLTSGPASRWSLRLQQSTPAGAGRAAAAAVAAGTVGAAADSVPAPAGAPAAADVPPPDGTENDPIPWTCGQPMMLFIEALDEAGSVDADYDAVVLIESAEHVSGKGFVRVTKGVGLAPLNSNKAGPIELSLQDGGFTRMEPPEPLFVRFDGGQPAKVALTPEIYDNAFPTAGDPLPVLVEIQDRFNNRCTEVDCEVVLAASHGAEFGDGPVQIEQGEATIQLVSEVAATVSLTVLEARGPAVEMIGDEGFSAVAHVPYLPGSAAVVQLALPPGAAPIAGERTKLLVCVADKFGNEVAPGSSNLAADLKVEPGPIGNASVERNGAASIADGTGEVWVRTEAATLPTEFYITSAMGNPGGLAIRHTQEEPFRATWGSAKITQIGLFQPEVEERATVGGGRMVLGVRTEDAWGNPRAGWDGSVLVVSASPHVSFASAGGTREAKVQLKDGEGRFEMVSDTTELFQLSLQDVAKTGLRTASVLRTRFKALPGVQGVFGEVPATAQPVGAPYPLPLLVLDRLGNVADDFEGEVPVSMTGGCRVAGRAPEIFRVVAGRATLPVLTTIAETVRFELDPATAILNKDEAAASAALRRYGFSTALAFCAADAQRLTLSVLAAPQGLAAAPASALPGEAGGGAAAAAAAVAAAAGPLPPLPTLPSGETQVRAGEEVLVAIKALDAYNNLVLHQQCTFFLEAELRPNVDEALTNTLATREPPQRYMLQLSNGEATQRVPTRLAGELSLRLVQPSVLSIDLSATAKLKVVAAPAVSIDVVNIPEAGRGGIEFELVVRALDPYGNVDEHFEREVELDQDGAPPGMLLQNKGVVKLTRGLGRCVAVASASAGSPGRGPA